MVGSHKGNRSTSVPLHMAKDMDSPPIISSFRFAPLDIELEDEENHGKFLQLERDNIPPVSAGIDLIAIKEKIRAIPPPKTVFLEKPLKRALNKGLTSTQKSKIKSSQSIGPKSLDAFRDLGFQ
ncbi:hypothetical protein ACH5RR_002720 [Cinchona calisaya]|uniref:Uncharacterized protein n=1 Tax=Cinchona calisaya TaxID=153742 RepID=A0ABD3ATC6_9GENT